MSNVDTPRPSCASTSAVINTESVATVGEAASYCFLKSPQSRPFMYPLRFYFRNISDATASALCFLASLFASAGEKNYRTYICFSYFVTAA